MRIVGTAASRQRFPGSLLFPSCPLHSVSLSTPSTTVMVRVFQLAPAVPGVNLHLLIPPVRPHPPPHGSSQLLVHVFKILLSRNYCSLPSQVVWSDYTCFIIICFFENKSLSHLFLLLQLTLLPSLCVLSRRHSFQNPPTSFVSGFQSFFSSGAFKGKKNHLFISAVFKFQDDVLLYGFLFHYRSWIFGEFSPHLELMPCGSGKFSRIISFIISCLLSSFFLLSGRAIISTTPWTDPQFLYVFSPVFQCLSFLFFPRYFLDSVSQLFH